MPEARACATRFVSETEFYMRSLRRRIKGPADLNEDYNKQKSDLAFGRTILLLLQTGHVNVYLYDARGVSMPLDDAKKRLKDVADLYQKSADFTRDRDAETHCMCISERDRHLNQLEYLEQLEGMVHITPAGRSS